MNFISGFQLELPQTKNKEKKNSQFFSVIFFSSFCQLYLTTRLAFVWQLSDLVEEHYICFVSVNGKAKSLTAAFHHPFICFSCIYTSIRN
jgi:hypothetical protein